MSEPPYQYIAARHELRDDLLAIEREIQYKVPFVVAGLMTFSKAEEFAYAILKENGFFRTDG